jgi:dGTPase
MVSSVIASSKDKPYIKFTDEIGQATMELRSFLFENVYNREYAMNEEEKAVEMLRILYDHYVKHPEELPGVYKKNLERYPVDRCVCDFVAGMTDRYAIDLFRELYVPSMWRRHL